jgi:hypothetical protein
MKTHYERESFPITAMPAILQTFPITAISRGYGDFGDSKVF